MTATAAVSQPNLFDSDGNPRCAVRSHFSLLGGDVSLPTRGATKALALHASARQIGVDLDPFWAGSHLLGLKAVGPQQIEIAEAMLAEDERGAPLHGELTICEPRRAAKTTTIWAVLLGLCATRPNYKVVVTAQTYVKARERFLDMARTIAPKNMGQFRILKGAAAEAIEWENGSRLWVVTPEGGAFRGDGADRILFDEAQEHSPDKTADLLAGALALMDTRFGDDVDLSDPDARPEGQIIIAGTAGEQRVGMLWDALERGRDGKIGIIEYAVPDEVQVALPIDSPEGRAARDAGAAIDKSGKWVMNESAILDAHPGIGTLTSLGVIRARFEALAVAKFRREYGGQWPYDLNTRAIDAGLWEATKATTPPPKPADYALGYDVAPDQTSAAVCAAWRDSEGRAWIEVIEHAGGDAWLPRAVYNLTRKHPRLRTAYDNIGPNQAVADRLNRSARPRPRLESLGTRDTTAAAATILSELGQKTLRHVVDPALDAAADLATRRNIGDGSFAWGRRKSGDISTLVAASSALKVYDRYQRARRPPDDQGRVSSAAALFGTQRAAS